MLQFMDLAAQQARIRCDIDARISDVLAHGSYIMGPEVAELEQELARFCGARHAITCANGTEALVLALMAKGLKPGEAVIVPSFTFCATAEAVCLLGGVPLFADVLEDTFNLDPASLVDAIAYAKKSGLLLRGVITVDLFGQPCDYDTIGPVVRENRLFLICDAAQAFGAEYSGRMVGTLGDITTTSFFPAKPLGCYGDGGAIFTEDDRAAEVICSLRVHGQGRNKYNNVRIGLNSRLDTLQAAILLAKLRLFPEEITLRNQVAKRYALSLAGLVRVPRVPEKASSVWAQYTVRVPERDRLVAGLKQEGVPTAVYYSRPLHRQIAYRRYPRVEPGLPATERLAAEVVSLPMHPWFSQRDQDRVVSALWKSFEGTLHSEA